MPFSSPHQFSLSRAQLRALAMTMGEPHARMPASTVLAAMAKHGGLYTMLDPAMMAARAAGFAPRQATQAIVATAQRMAESFFFKLVDSKGYTIHSELMAYIAEPGRGNGVAYSESVEASPTIPAVFTFVGQFIDHDLTFNGMNLTADQTGAVFADDATPVIDLDSVYGPRSSSMTDAESAAVEQHVFDAKGRFRLRPIREGSTVVGYDLCRHPGTSEPECGRCRDEGMAYVFDPRNDENQLILQIHVLVERFHNALISAGLFTQIQGESGIDFAHRVRAEVVATWQSMILSDYLPTTVLGPTLAWVRDEIRRPGSPAKPHERHGALRYKPLRDPVTGRRTVGMPHEFAIGFRFGHSQLRPMYQLNKDPAGDYRVVLLFQDARASPKVAVSLPGGATAQIDGGDDLRGNRQLGAEHVIDWDVFYPAAPTPQTQSSVIDGLVTARVFNLPESAIPDDIKYIGNLPHRNLIRSSQIGIVSGEELAEFYRTPPARLPDPIAPAPAIPLLAPADVISITPPGGGPPVPPPAPTQALNLFKLDKLCPEDEGEFKTPLWYYLLKEAEKNSSTDRGRLGPLGSRLVAEVLTGACYYGQEFPFDDGWISKAFGKHEISLRDIIGFVAEHGHAHGECGA